MVQLKDLPDEILVAVLQQLPVEDLLTCRAVSSSLKSLISSSLLLQYRIVLGAQALLDNAVSTVPSSRKLGQLRSSAKSWRRLDFSRLYDRRRVLWRSWARNGRTGEPPLVRAAEDRHKEYSTKIPVHNYAAVYELAGGCFFQDLNSGWPFGPAPMPGAAIGNVGHGGAVGFVDDLDMMMGVDEAAMHLIFAEGLPFVGAGDEGDALLPVPPPFFDQNQGNAGVEANDDDAPILIHDATPAPELSDTVNGNPYRPRPSTLAWTALPSRRTLRLNVDENPLPTGCATGGPTPSVDNLSSPQARPSSTPEQPHSNATPIGANASSDTTGTTKYKPHWHTIPFDFKVADLCVDVERDLLVAVERSDESEHVVTASGVHKHVWHAKISLLFLSLSKSSSGFGSTTSTSSTDASTSSSSASGLSSEPLSTSSVDESGPDRTVRHFHPDALNPTLQATCPSEFVCMRPGDYSMVVQLAGDYIGVLLSCRHNRRDQGGIDGKSDWFWLWNWVRGTCLVSTDGGNEQWDAFCFVGSHAIMIPNSTGHGALNVFFFDEDRNSISSGVDATDELEEDGKRGKWKSPFRHALTLQLPETIYAHAIAHIAIRSEPPPSGRSVPRSSGQWGAPDHGKRGNNEELNGGSKRKLPTYTDPRPFGPDPEEGMILLTIDYLVPPRRPMQRVPASALQPLGNHAHAHLDANEGQNEHVDPDDLEHVDDAAHWMMGDGWGDGPALVIDGFQISLAHPQVVALRRKDVMRWARGAEAVHRRREREKRQFANSKGKGKGKARADDFENSGEHTASPSFSNGASTTFDPVKKRVPHMHAKDWIRRTRWGLSAPPARWVFYSSGTRFVSMEDRPFGSDRRVGVRVYDFNVRPLKRRKQGLGAIDSESEDDVEELDLIDVREYEDGAGQPQVSAQARPHPYPIKRVVVQDKATRVHLPEIFRSDFNVELPYRMIETEAIFDWDSCMIDDERIIGLKEEEHDAGNLERLEVLVL